jgi:aerobic-type carbon monoxide dehydrogenase small subunit (CoxS/CutS family)
MRNIQQALAARSVEQPEKSYSLNVNGLARKVEATADTPLLFVLREQLHLSGPRYGCGLAQCGTCTVHLDGVPIRSCVTPVASVVGKKIVSLEGVAAAHRNALPSPLKAPDANTKLHPVQQAWIELQVPQCGYCQNGWLMYSTALLNSRAAVSKADIKRYLKGLKCRCSTQRQILDAVELAATRMGKLKSSSTVA